MLSTWSIFTCKFIVLTLQGNDLPFALRTRQITCQECSRVSGTEAEFLDVPVALSGQAGLEDALKTSFINLEQLNGSNQYFCNRCQKLVDAEKVSKKRSYKKILNVIFIY